MKKREANLELLRVITMIMIVTMHLVNHGAMLDLAESGTVSYQIAWGLMGLGIPTINIYILISSYFLVESRFSSWRLVKLGMQVWFYAMVITLYFWISGRGERDREYMVMSLTPIISDFYWFITMYVGMYILSPLLNHFVKSLSKRKHQCVLVLCFVQFSVWTNIFYYTSGMNIAGGISISWFLVMYLFGAYIRIYDVGRGQYRKWLAAGVVFELLIPLSRVVIVALQSTPLAKTGIPEDLLWGYSVFYQYNSMLATAAAICLFVGFLGIKIRPGRISDLILLMGSTAIGVYLIHEHYYIRIALWDTIKPWSWLYQWYMLPKIVLTVLGIYVVCSALELMRRLIFRPLDKSKRLHEFCEKIDMKLEKLWNGN
ncbi:MAG: acyltransferase [Lachnospiraceae bacterium]|nr:acyltransferase [Lachnospiraceae bacterium]